MTPPAARALRTQTEVLEPAADEVLIRQALESYALRHPDTLADLPELPDASAKPTAVPKAMWALLAWRLKHDRQKGSDLRILRLRSSVERTLEEIGRPRNDQVSGASLRPWARALDHWIEDLGVGSELSEDQLAVLRYNLLPASFPVVQLCWRRQVALAAWLLIDQWQKATAQLGINAALPSLELPDLQAPLRAIRSLYPLSDADRRLMFLFQTEVLGLIRHQTVRQESLATLHRLRQDLDLDTGQLARLLETNPAEIDSWMASDGSLPAAATARLSAYEEPLRRLEEMFVAERLPQVVRRPAELFEGLPAIEWILDGRLGEVVDRYELLLTYQV